MTNDARVKIDYPYGRKQLQLDPQYTAWLKQISTPDARLFLLWTLFHFCLWALGAVAVVTLRGQPWLQAAAGLLMGNQLHTLTIMQHECLHQSAFRSKADNTWMGRFLGWFIFMPFTTYAELHRMHHGFLGDSEKDPDEWFYAAGPRVVFLREILFLPRFIYLSIVRPPRPGMRHIVLFEFVFNLVTYTVLIRTLLWAGATDVLLFCFALPMLLIAVVINPLARGYEHYPMSYLHPDDPRRYDLRYNTITVTSPVLGFLWANIIFHVEHHLYPRVPFYRLPDLHRILASTGNYHQVRMPLTRIRVRTVG
jgi:fatty acid desaturase